MNKHFSLILLLLVFLNGCKNSEENVPVINIDVTDAETVNLSEIATDISVVPIKLPNDKYVAEISYVKKINGYFFLLDRDVSPSITILDSNGQYVDQLRRIGYGPEEFAYLENFNLNSKNELMIYDRERLRLVYYSFPDLKYLRSSKMTDYWMALEAIDDNSLVVVNDTDTESGEYKGVQILNANSMEPRVSDFGSYPMAIEASFDQAITKTSSGVFYTNPGEFTTVYKVEESGFNPFLKLDFGDASMDQSKWEQTNIGDFMREMSREGKVAGAYAFLSGKEVSSFWYMYESFQNHYLAVFKNSSSKAKSYSKIRVTGVKEQLKYPRGIMGDQYYHIIYKSDLDSDYLNMEQNQNSIFSTIYKSSPEDETPFLLTYKLK